MSDNDVAEVKTNNKKMIAGASGTILAFVSVVFAYIDSKTADLDKRIEDKYIATRDYVDSRHAQVQNKLESIEKLLIKIDDRVYLINKNTHTEE
jgi:hypothetical protein